MKINIGDKVRFLFVDEKYDYYFREGVIREIVPCVTNCGSEDAKVTIEYVDENEHNALHTASVYRIEEILSPQHELRKKYRTRTY